LTVGAYQKLVECLAVGAYQMQGVVVAYQKQGVVVAYQKQGVVVAYQIQVVVVASLAVVVCQFVMVYHTDSAVFPVVAFQAVLKDIAY